MSTARTPHAFMRLALSSAGTRKCVALALACAALGGPGVQAQTAGDDAVVSLAFVGDVMLAAPDIDLTVFQQQIARLGKSIRVSVFVSRADRALSLSSRIAGDRQRVGAMDPTKPRDADALA